MEQLISFLLRSMPYIDSLLFVEQKYALKVIEETNGAWANLVKRSVPAGELSLV